MKSSGKKILVAFLVIPFVAHIIQALRYSYGAYDGKHCAGLLDAAPECTELEYYLDYIFGFFGLVNLAYYYIIAVIIIGFIAVFLKLKGKFSAGT